MTNWGGDVVGKDGQLEAYMKFYAWASDDQMPLRNVIVNWGMAGANPTAGAEGKYKNQKPRCQRTWDKVTFA